MHPTDKRFVVSTTTRFGFALPAEGSNLKAVAALLSSVREVQCVDVLSSACAIPLTRVRYILTHHA